MIRERAYGELIVRLASPYDAEALAPELSLWDLVEVFAAGSDPLTSLTAPFWYENGPSTRTVIWRDRVIGMGGVTPSPRGNFVWYLGSDLPEAATLPFLTASREWSKLALAEFGRLENVIPRKHKRAQRWLAWLGFDISPEILHIRGVEFMRFSMEATDGPRDGDGPR